MGRVYNALVRAEKLKEGDRPIGRPNRNGAARDERGDDAISFPFSASAVYEKNLALTPDLRSAVASQALVTAERIDASQSPQAPSRPVLAPRPIVESPPTSGPVFIFEEPSAVANIRDLVADPRFLTLTRENPSSVERYRALAVKLLNLMERRKVKTLLITSAEAGEGKTTVATAVAWSLAKRLERRVLLIDANIAAPSVGRTLGIDPKGGWLGRIDGLCELKDALVRVDPNGLYVMTPGPAGKSQSIDSSRLEDVIAEAAPHFDLIVVDSPAILESPESQRLAEVLDGAVIVARACHTNHNKVSAARKLVPKERRLGIVLNESEADSDISPRRRGKWFLAGRLFGRKR